MMHSNSKDERLKHANHLISIIASCGRRFFFDGNTERVAFMHRSPDGKIYFFDARTGTLIYTHRTSFSNKWRGFSHGGTLRGLVEMMRDYISKGTQIDEWYLGMPRGDGTNAWGYPQEDIDRVRSAAKHIPIIKLEQSND